MRSTILLSLITIAQAYVASPPDGSQFSLYSNTGGAVVTPELALDNNLPLIYEASTTYFRLAANEAEFSTPAKFTKQGKKLLYNGKQVNGKVIYPFGDTQAKGLQATTSPVNKTDQYNAVIAWDFSFDGTKLIPSQNGVKYSLTLANSGTPYLGIGNIFYHNTYAQHEWANTTFQTNVQARTTPAQLKGKTFYPFLTAYLPTTGYSAKYEKLYFQSNPPNVTLDLDSQGTVFEIDSANRLKTTSGLYVYVKPVAADQPNQIALSSTAPSDSSVVKATIGTFGDNYIETTYGSNKLQVYYQLNPSNYSDLLLVSTNPAGPRSTKILIQVI